MFYKQTLSDQPSLKRLSNCVSGAYLHCEFFLFGTIVVWCECFYIHTNTIQYPDIHCAVCVCLWSKQVLYQRFNTCSINYIGSVIWQHGVVKMYAFSRRRWRHQQNSEEYFTKCVFTRSSETGVAIFGVNKWCTVSFVVCARWVRTACTPVAFHVCVFLV